MCVKVTDMARRASLLGRGVAAAASVALLTLVNGCAPIEERGVQPIAGWFNGGTLQSLMVDTCQGDPVAVVEENDQTATITVTSTKYNTGTACLDGLQVELNRPLGDRQVIDGATDKAPPGIEG